MSSRTATLDWAAAVKVGRSTAPTGPRVGAAEAADVVLDLRQFSREAELAVREVTGLGVGLPVLDAVVVDRPGWVSAAAQGMEVLATPMIATMARKLAESKKADAAKADAAKGDAAKGDAAKGDAAKGDAAKPRGRRRHQAPGRSARAAAAVGAAPIGVVLGYLSAKVLGQYDPFSAGPAADGTMTGDGRLLLVAPNIVAVEREIGADPQDFRRWVCVHESTHRLQFTAVPWLRDHFSSLVAEFADTADLDQAELLDRLKKAITERSSSGRSWVEMTQNADQLVVFHRLMALMTLLEGHADHVMDAVGPAVIPTVGQIREAFTERRRQGRGPWDRLVRSLLGMDVKMAQYVKGAAFVDAVVTQVGMADFNRVWESPANLPTMEEITDPAAWVTRVIDAG